MQDAETVLEVLRERGRKGLRYHKELRERSLIGSALASESRFKKSSTHLHGDLKKNFVISLDER